MFDITGNPTEALVCPYCSQQATQVKCMYKNKMWYEVRFI